MNVRSVCVFCGSSSGARAAYAASARELGGLLVARGQGLVYGGGDVGLMGLLADAVLEAGGEVLGVIPAALAEKEVAHAGLTRLEIVGSMHERKALMARHADAFLALPGGLGTFEELFEVLTWSQLGLHGKPCGLLDVEGYWTPLLTMLDRAVDEGFLSEGSRGLVSVDTDPARLLDGFEAYRAPGMRRWLEPDEA